MNRPAQDIIIENSHFAYGHGGVAMGSETSGGIRNVEVRNCISDSGNWAPIRFKRLPRRGGVVENITYRDIKLLDKTYSTLKLVASDRDGPTGRVKFGAEGTSGLDTLTVRDITFERSRGFALESVDGAEIRDVIFSNII